MAVSQNGWTAYISGLNLNLKSFRWITGRMRKGDTTVIFEDLCQWFNDNVEPINPAHSWGFAARPIRGGVTLSNHSSGTAVDLNAPKHPLGRSGTFTGAQVARIKNKLKEYDGVIRWGYGWARPDEMHFELNANAARVKVVADRIRRGGTIVVKPVATIKPKPKPKPAATRADLAVQEKLQKMKLYSGHVDGVNASLQKSAVKAFQKAHGLFEDGAWAAKTEAKYKANVRLQEALNRCKGTKLVVDGYIGASTRARVKDVKLRNGWATKKNATGTVDAAFINNLKRIKAYV